MAGNQRMLLANDLVLLALMQELGEKLADAGRRHAILCGEPSVVGTFTGNQVMLKPTKPRGVKALEEHGHRGHAADRRQ